MGNVQVQNGVAATSSPPLNQPTAPPPTALPTTTATTVSEVSSAPKKKICCACPETKKLRDECIVEHGEDACAKWIEAHRICLRSEGFNV